MLYSLKLLQKHAHGQHASVCLAATVDEEVSYRGVVVLAESGLKANAAIVGEPTNLIPVIAHKGVVRFRIRTRGHAVHTAMLEHGNNAIYQMVEVIRTLREKIEPRLRSSAFPKEIAPTLCISTIHGGLQVNMVPDECVIEIDRRTAPGESPAQVLAEFDAVLDDLRRADPTFTIERLEPDVSDWALDTPRGATIAQSALAACRTIRGDADFGAVPYGSDASKLAELAHIPSIVFGPGNIAQAHTGDEWVEIAQVVQAAEIYAQTAIEFGNRISRSKG
ncbi:MAG TPA: M20/M25/M40 family metallo-hydrolase, partial [Anaerolineae bacterium]|nr:M20/M25/M40 family metallo-hydrolase [Anaerolineae bacterium]